jgi:hypothetical protein
MSERKPYKRRKDGTRLPDVSFDVETLDGTVAMTARHLLYHELAGLNHQLIGQLTDKPDPSGRFQLKERRLKLAKVLVSADTGEPDPDVPASGADEKAWTRFLRLDGNENLTWLGWGKYLEALEGATPKSGTEDDSRAADARGREEEPDDGPDAFVHAV